jgi:hypothetical protein
MAVADADQLSQHGFIDVGQLVDVEARRTPHLRFLARQLRHEGAEPHAVLAAHRVLQGRDEVVRRNPCHLCLVIRHGRSVLGRPQGSGIKAGPPGLSE